jgi:hypothetical protein
VPAPVISRHFPIQIHGVESAFRRRLIQRTPLTPISIACPAEFLKQNNGLDSAFDERLKPWANLPAPRRRPARRAAGAICVLS